ncbi:MAG: flagellar basal body P-ring formation chaperone FlgA [Desulfotalea sp.]
MVKAKFIILSDIVSFSEENQKIDELKSIVISQSPSLGKTVTINQNDILRKLASQNMLPPDIYWHGSDSTIVKRIGNIVTQDQIENIILSYIEENLPDFDTSFTPSGTVPSLSLPNGTLTYEVKPSRSAIIGSKHFTIRFFTNGKLNKNIVIRGQLKVIAPIAVATESLRKNAILNSSNYIFDNRDINKLRGAILNTSQIEGYKLTRRISNNAPILLSNLDKVPVVNRGQRVKVIVHSGKLQLSMIGIAKGNGGINDMIKVLNISSNKTIYATVTGPGLVEVRI